MQNLDLGRTGTPHPARMQVEAAVLQSVLLRDSRVARPAEGRGPAYGLPIGSPFRGRVPLISPLLFGGK